MFILLLPPPLQLSVLPNMLIRSAGGAKRELLLPCKNHIDDPLRRWVNGWMDGWPVRVDWTHYKCPPVRPHCFAVQPVGLQPPPPLHSSCLPCRKRKRVGVWSCRNFVIAQTGKRSLHTPLSLGRAGQSVTNAYCPVMPPQLYSWALHG